jgi:imidazolonepropionase-like amidohydrolase
MLRTLAGAMLAVCAVATSAADRARDTILLHGATIVALDADAPRGPQDLLIRDGRIVEIGPSGGRRVADTRVIDATGRFVMPGLVEMHAHVPPHDSPQLQGVLDLFLAHGVTTVRGVIGEPGQLALRKELDSGTRRGPRLYTAGRSLNGNSVADATAAVALVEAQKRDGYDLIKLHPGLDVARFDAIASTARRIGLPIAGHVSEAVGLEHALRGGTGTVEHMDDYVRALVPADRPERTASPGFFGVAAALAADETRVAELVALTREANAYVVPTETLMVSLLGDDDIDALLGREEFAYVDAGTRAKWRTSREDVRAQAGAEQSARFLRLRRALLRALYAEGRVILGSDAPQMFNVPGASLHREAALMVEAGMPVRDVLRSGTLAPAQWLGAGERRGRIAIGQDADLLLLDADPLLAVDNTRRIAGVMVGGRWHDRVALDAILAAVRREAGN